VILHLVSRNSRPTTAEDYAATMLQSRLAGYQPKIKRLDVRLDEVETEDGREEKICRVQVHLITRLDVAPFGVDAHAPSAREAVDLVVDTIEGAVRRALEIAEARKHGYHKRVGRPKREVPVPSAPRHIRLRREYPDRERVREDEGAVMSANPPRGRHFHMTRVEAAATSAREDSNGRPSRKSTRKSANRSKRDSNQARRVQRGVRAPEARAERAQARAQRAQKHKNAPAITG
jgi:hypothetical protein